jgi:hypothetical protein
MRGSVDGIKNHCSNVFLCQNLKSKVSFVQLKPIFDYVVSVSPAGLVSLKLLFL